MKLVGEGLGVLQGTMVVRGVPLGGRGSFHSLGMGKVHVCAQHGLRQEG